MNFDIPIFKELEQSQSILIAGCGGGYDFFGGLPFYFALKKQNKSVHLANFSFTSNLNSVSGKKYGQFCVAVTADSVRTNVPNYKVENENYFPELLVSIWLRKNEKIEQPIYAIDRATGPAELQTIYQEIIDEHKIDTVLLVDNGTDSLCRGDEEQLGSPIEDMTSICAVNNVKVSRKILITIGMGVDAYHGVNNYRVFENIALLSKQGAFLGTFSLTKEMEIFKKMNRIYLECQPHNSIVCASVTSAVLGEFGNYHHEAIKSRVSGSELFINPLMGIYWCFKLEFVAKNILYLHKIKDCKTRYEVQQEIWKDHREYFNEKNEYIGKRKDRSIPH